MLPQTAAAAIQWIRDRKGRKHKHFQFLTEDIGDVHLEKQIVGGNDPSACNALMGNGDFSRPCSTKRFHPRKEICLHSLDVERFLDERFA